MFGTDHLHPMVVHFPIALLILGFLAEMMYLFSKAEWLYKAATLLMVIGTFGTVAGYLTGEFFTAEMDGPKGELKELHELIAKTTMFIMIAASFIRLWMVIKKKEKSGWYWLTFVLYLAGAVSVGITGYLGGSLVYGFLIK
jgi:uncharacterized membrane protein